MPDLSEVKQKHRATWASGNYARIANGILNVADHVVRAARIRSGEHVLDVACGTGNTTLMARARTPHVTGLDLTPELLAIAQQRASAEGYRDITWKVGDAEEMPFADRSFDVVTSSCGLMFAPDHSRVAAEVARVTKPGGRIAIQAWTRAGGVGKMFAVSGKYVPPPPGASSPFEWGDEAAVQRLLGDTFRDFRFERYDSPEFSTTPEACADLYIDWYGPTNRAYHSLPADKASAMRQDLVELYRGYITPADGTVRWGREYIITLATRR